MRMMRGIFTILEQLSILLRRINRKLFTKFHSIVHFEALKDFATQRIFEYEWDSIGPPITLIQITQKCS